MARDLQFPDYFSDEARDLIDKLLDVDASKRPGAGPDGYAALKKHPFFRGIDWKYLRQMPPPKLALEPHEDEEEEAQDPAWNLSHVGSTGTGTGTGTSTGTASNQVTPSTPNGGGATSSSSDAYFHLSRLASIDSFDSRWQEFLEPGEAIVMISKLKKVQKITNKKVQLLLTDKPKLIIVDPSKMQAKCNILWSDDPNCLSVHVANSSHFKISTPKKVISFEDVKERAWQWKNAIEALQSRNVR